MNIEHFTPSIVPAEQVSGLWEENDVLIFIIDLNDYPSPDAKYLDETEKVHLATLKTEYFKNRYVISRMILKHLSGYLKKRSWSDMVICKDQHGRVHVCDHDNLHVCISYTENTIALAFSKTEIGIDIELIRSRSLEIISRSVDKASSVIGPAASSYDFLVMWTLKEACCKISNETMFSNLTRKLDLTNVYPSSYVIDNRYILAVVRRSHHSEVKIVRLQKIDH